MNNLHPTIQFTFEHSTQEISFLDMKIHTAADCKLSLTLYRKSTDCASLLHFHSNHSLKCKESIVFSQIQPGDTLLQKELDSHAVSLLSRQYPLEIIIRNISKALLHCHYTLLYRSPKAASPKTVLPIVTINSPERTHFSQLVQNCWHIIKNDLQLQSTAQPSHHYLPQKPTSQGDTSAFLTRQTNISTFFTKRIPPIVATGIITTYMQQPYPSQPQLFMGTHLLILATLYATWVAPPTYKLPSHFHHHVLHSLQYHIPPTLLPHDKH